MTRVKPKLDVLAGPVPNDGGGRSWVIRLRGSSYPGRVYLVASMDCHASFGRAFRLRQLGRRVAPYKVQVNGPDCSCDCRGFELTGRCKHVWAARQL